MRNCLHCKHHTRLKQGVFIGMSACPGIVDARISLLESILLNNCDQGSFRKDRVHNRSFQVHDGLTVGICRAHHRSLLLEYLVCPFLLLHVCYLPCNQPIVDLSCMFQFVIETCMVLQSVRQALLSSLSKIVLQTTSLNHKSARFERVVLPLRGLLRFISLSCSCT